MKHLSILMSAIMVAFMLGCTTAANLEEGGIYADDAFLFNVDTTITTSYEMFNTFVLQKLNDDFRTR